ncbi:YebC/PmpR family DNA-binding transcriptional regulator [Candidatus Berkelbacteria bacterium CG10_big_fil_rev_8_21_14_0_10_33_10]|uniref:Probable transcriptional regulatory protein COX60_00060 n=1 Tax=Candidatus Berkelbacteria bacterium CG_4_10_14_0_2_um_filter_35_9_33_12 TaxID=1974499 RepID=A0A2M7W4X7_9BACT|nr:MAG: YebC/PmpR family DNA-binding transcriptional regulator [Candidatus Berkelbacteria bacterium CG23_combo_of_CG06-09_8_20_14_all_33_15]PIS08175.1 MAG: YebC/PmpR family DNA-binding transcriptional regulator [Candidatus Berkelbacteria bacterium CG10_big_fil_rev_8_21_14_0_10_33_10]PJA20996.1 MAG: YebC/PmpR family DNA-binding transcriptional regulator [Candidatus Berkelbacteria bacterium CG_4_10_14_0_2_um_filter_35_9_33_12]
MSGHSKWSTIKHKKALVDAKRGKLFSKLANIISIASKNGTDPILNPSLRLAIEKAKKAEMPTVNIQRAIDRGSGKSGAIDLKEETYEAYGLGGVGLIIETISDNLIRTIAEIRAVLNRNNSKLAENGAVSFQFVRVGQIIINKDSLSNDLELELIDYGAEDIFEKNNEIIIYSKVEDLNKMVKYFEEKKIEIIDSEIIYQPKNIIKIDEKKLEKLNKLIVELENLDDITNIYSNYCV